jgi:hypothetical protein
MFRRTFKWIVLCLIMGMLTTGGCTPTSGAFAGGAAAGGALSQTFAGAQKDLQTRQQQLLAELQENVKQLEAATDETDKEILIAKNAALKKKIEQVETMQQGVTVAEQAVKTDWTNPESIGLMATTAIAAVIAYLNKRKGDATQKQLTAVDEGVTKFKALSQPEVAQQLYLAIHDRKVKAGLSQPIDE